MIENSELVEDLSRLIRTSSAKGFEVAEVNFSIGRVMSQLCQEGGEKAIDEAAALLNGRGIRVFPDFLFNTYRVFKSIRHEGKLQEIKKNLHGNLQWGFLVTKCTKAPEGETEESERYWGRCLREIEESHEKMDNVLEHYESLPSSVKPQVAGVLAAMGYPSIGGRGGTSDEKAGVMVPVISEKPTGVRRQVRKILHIGDEHFDDCGLLSEVEKSSRYIVESAKEEMPDLIISAGDILDCRQTHDSPALSSCIAFVRELAEIAPVFILKGTTSHDGMSVKFFETLNTRHKVYVSETIEQVGFSGGNFFPVDCYTEGLDAIIYSLPPASKANILAKAGANLQDANKEVSALLKGVFAIWGGMSDMAHENSVPAIIVGHGTVIGAVSSTGQKMTGKDIEFGRSDIADARADVVCLGHIHKAQAWEEDGIHYCGSITKLNMGETEDKGFWIHEFTTEGRKSRFVVVPTKDIIAASFEGFPDFEQLPDISKDSLVRVCYKVSEEDVHKIDENALREQILAKGAAEVRIEKTVVPKQMVRAAGISQMTTLEEKAKKWGETTGTAMTEGILQKARLLLQPPDCVFRELGLELPARRFKK